MKARKFFAAALAGALMLGACGSSYNRDDAINDLVNDAGIERETAVCIVDGIEDNFSIDRLESTGDLTEDEEAILTEITTDCILGGFVLRFTTIWHITMRLLANKQNRVTFTLLTCLPEFYGEERSSNRGTCRAGHFVWDAG